MKHPSVRALFEYWNARRGLRAAPERADIEPGPIRGALADSFILAFDPPAGHPFRLAGTRLCAMFGRELKGEAFAAFWGDRTERKPIADLLGIVANETVGVVASARGRSAGGTERELELLLLPLRHRGRTDARLLGALAPTDAPAWLGTMTLSTLKLDTLRYVGPDYASPVAAFVGARQQGRIRRGLLVYDGGRDG